MTPRTWKQDKVRLLLRLGERLDRPAAVETDVEAMKLANEARRFARTPKSGE